MKIQINDEVREATDEEIDSYEQQSADNVALKQDLIQKRNVAKQKLIELGLEESDLKALGLA